MMTSRPEIEASARQTLKENRVAIFLVAYNAEKHIEKVLERIPRWVAREVVEIYVIDDHSQDDTVKIAQNIPWPTDLAPLRIYRTPRNQGYGGNQRLGYLYAIAKKFDIVVLLHADGQYAPEALPEILAPYTSENADAVFGSRFLKPIDALKGHMPLYKWLGNRVLTRMQNFLLKSKMSEMHSGYRSYRTGALKEIPFEYNSPDFDFDADIIVQFLAMGFKIVEVPIPTYYGDEICHVNGMQYAWNCVKTAAKYRLMQLEIFYDPKFDFRKKGDSPYTVKHSETSLHHYMRTLDLPKDTRILDAGGGRGEAVSLAHAEQNRDVTCIDAMVDPLYTDDDRVKQIQVDLNFPWRAQFPNERKYENFDVIFALDVLEHLLSPEKGAKEIFDCLRPDGKLYASTGNIAFLPLRMMHIFGQFNYGRRGILDLTHCRLFTVASFKRLMRNSGFRVDEVIGFGPPLGDVVSKSPLMKLVDRVAFWFAKKWPTLFAFQILLVCTRLDSIKELMTQSFPENQLEVEDRQYPLIS